MAIDHLRSPSISPNTAKVIILLIASKYKIATIDVNILTEMKIVLLVLSCFENQIVKIPLINLCQTRQLNQLNLLYQLRDLIIHYSDAN